MLVALLVLLEVWGLDVVRWLSSDAGGSMLRHLVTIALVLVFTLIVWEGINIAIERSVTERDAGRPRLGGRTRTPLNITRRFVLVFLGLIALFLILSELGVNIAPLLAGAGVIGLAIGFGSQKLVQDIIPGMFVLFSDTLRVGDVVEVAARSGCGRSGRHAHGGAARLRRQHPHHPLQRDRHRNQPDQGLLRGVRHPRRVSRKRRSR